MSAASSVGSAGARQRMLCFPTRLSRTAATASFSSCVFWRSTPSVSGRSNGSVKCTGSLSELSTAGRACSMTTVPNGRGFWRQWKAASGKLSWYLSGKNPSAALPPLSSGRPAFRSFSHTPTRYVRGGGQPLCRLFFPDHLTRSWYFSTASIMMAARRWMIP